MQPDFSLSAFDYELPESHIAQYPADRRDASRLMVLNRQNGSVEHLQFSNITRFFSPGDVLVVNNTKVFPARLYGTKESGGKAELFLLSYPVPVEDGVGNAISLFDCDALIKSSRRPPIGSQITLTEHCRCRIMADLGRGAWRVRLTVSASEELGRLLSMVGQVPLPPYIKRPNGPSPDDTDRYQTVYAERPGAVAAPTAGLHFTDALLDTLRTNGIILTSITLHVGYGTFAPVQHDDIRNHAIHREHIEISEDTAQLITTAKTTGHTVWAVGTTTVRALEYATSGDGVVVPVHGWCDLYITPGFRFRAVDNLITNFHLPRSSLLFLVAALCGRERLLACYREAISRNYRFYSYGDAMAIIG